MGGALRGARKLTHQRQGDDERCPRLKWSNKESRLRDLPPPPPRGGGHSRRVLAREMRIGQVVRGVQAVRSGKSGIKAADRWRNGGGCVRLKAEIRR